MGSVSQIMSDYWNVQKHVRESGVKDFIELYDRHDDSILRKLWWSFINKLHLILHNILPSEVF